MAKVETAQAQAITPALDGTGSVVTQDGQTFNIQAGSVSANGENLFHSFQDFQLIDGQVVNFLVDPSTQNIFSRISDTNTAFIDGHIQISDSQANLFLLNPAGVIFGPNASLNLPADLTVTTATRIGFTDGWFNALGRNSYGNLIGDPTAYAVNASGVIRNQADLALAPNQSLTLLGGTVINVGELMAKDVILRDVSGDQVIRVSQTGSLLDLELPGNALQYLSEKEDSDLTSTMLPSLLTSGTVDQANTILTNAEGQTYLADSSQDQGTPDNHNSGQTSEPAAHRQTQTARSQSQTRGKLHSVHRSVLNTTHASAALSDIEEQRHQEFSSYFGRDLHAKQLTLTEIQQMLTGVRSQTGNRSVVVYIKPPRGLSITTHESSSTALELLIFQATEDPIRLEIPGVSQNELFQTVGQFRQALISSSRMGSKRYLSSAQKLHQWLISPIEAELGAASIDTILFSMDAGLRSLPIAALHDGEQFLIEKYSLGMVPSMGLMNPDYQGLDNAQVLAMGVSSFKALQPLPAVPAEIDTIGELWPGRQFLNETFTQKNLISQQEDNPAQIIHLATHAEFSAGNAEESYIQLWDEKLRLSDIHTLGWDRPTVDLLVLSACKTALGNADAEMGFAGLAVAAGVKSALASLWVVSDVGTLGLMSEFYHQLQSTSIKSEALRTAQLAMINGSSQLETAQLPIDNSQLPPELRENLDELDLSHPYYWAGFTLIGNPW